MGSILVLGGAGYIGSHTVCELIVYEGDIRDEASVKVL